VVSVGRYAPSTTGRAHAGTLLAALLSWLDARSQQGRVLLRLEDIDPERSTPELVGAMQRDLEWLGLEWDGVERQSDHAEAHLAALDQLAAKGLLYPCSCSRAQVKATGRPAPDGSIAYPGTCRERRLPADGWRATLEPLRVRLPDDVVAITDESGATLTQAPGLVMGDPVVRRRDGAVAYQLAVVVDDAASGVTRVVRGRDIAPSTATQVALQRYLGLSTPTYRHHPLLLEPHGDKLAKLHGSAGAPELYSVYSPAALVGVLANLVGLEPVPRAITPRELVPGFTWGQVRTADIAVRWTGRSLEAIRP
jgi:glutamyl-Q tRNA(Asp) synthetase